MSEADSVRAVHAALDLGINFFDSAPAYGTAQADGVAEVVLGKALGSRRDEAVISTKFGRKISAPPKFDAAEARASVEASLQRLDTDRIDVLFLHSPFADTPVHDDVWAELESLKAEGKIRVVGHSVSQYPETNGWAREWASDGRIDVIQVVLSLLNRETMPLIEALGAQRVGVVARESLANGFLSGSVTKDTVFPEHSLNARYSREEVAARADAAQRLSFLVRDDIESLPQAALRWVLDTPFVSTVLVGAKSEAELRDGASASWRRPFTAEERQRAADLHDVDYPAA